jgi:DNA adenine methylase
MMAPWIIQHFPAHRIYCEPFGGGASVLLQKLRSYSEVYNDLDEEVVNLFRVLRDPQKTKVLKGKLANTPFARVEMNHAYDIDPAETDIERARKTIVKSFMGYGSDSLFRKSGFRSDCKRSGTVPAHDWVNYVRLMDIFTERLMGVVVENRDAFSLISQHDSPETLFYCDPPYLHATRVRAHRESYKYELTDQQHKDLGTLLHSVKGMVVLSGYPSDLYDKKIYSDWTRFEKKATTQGGKRIEVLWLNKEAKEKLMYEMEPLFR